MATIVTPGNDKAAIAQRRYRRIVLGTARPGVDPELVTDRTPDLVVKLGPDIVARAAALRTAVIRPGNHIITVGKTRNRRLILAARVVRIDLGLTVVVAGNAQFLAIGKRQRLDTVQTIRTIRRRRIRDRDLGAVCVRRYAVVFQVAGEHRRVGTRAAINRVISGTARDHVTARTAVDLVNTTAAADRVGTRATAQNIITNTADKRIRARSTNQSIRTGTAIKQVTRVVGGQNVIAALTVNAARIIARDRNDIRAAARINSLRALNIEGAVDTAGRRWKCPIPITLEVDVSITSRRVKDAIVKVARAARVGKVFGRQPTDIISVFYLNHVIDSGAGQRNAAIIVRGNRQHTIVKRQCFNFGNNNRPKGGIGIGDG